MPPPSHPDDVAWSVTLTMNIRRGEGDGEGAPVATFIGATAEEAIERAEAFLETKRPGMYLPTPGPRQCGTYKTPWGLVWSVPT